MDQLLNIPKERKLFPAAKGVGGAAETRAAGPADAMNIGFRDLGQVELDDVREFLDIDAAGGNIRRDQDAGFMVLEIAESVLTGILGFVSVDGLGGEAGVLKGAYDLIRAVLRARKNERRFDLGAVQKMDQQMDLIPAVDAVYRLSDGVDCGRGRRDIDAIWVREDRARELFDLGRHRRRKEHRLPLRREIRHDAPDVVNHAHVEHAVRLVQHEEFNLVEFDVALIHQVEETPRSRDEDVHAGLEASDLRVLGYAAENNQRAQAQMTAVGDEAIVDLDRELARRSQYQCTDPAAADGLSCGIGSLSELLKDRQGERGGLAGAGLSATQKISAGHQGWDRGLLNRRSGRITLFIQGFKNAGRKPQL